MPKKRHKPEEIVAKLRQVDEDGPSVSGVRTMKSTAASVRVADTKGRYPLARVEEIALQVVHS